VPKENAFGEAISVLNRAARVYLSRALAPYGLGPGQQAYLITMGEDEGLSQEQIARRHRVDKANAARAVQGLEKLGYVERRRSAHDGRQWEVRLTDKGIDVRAKVIAVLDPWVKALAEGLSEQQWKTTVRALSRMADNAMHYAHSYPADPSA
jgi:DNA-binding MarR family transcriptional regulator